MDRIELRQPHLNLPHLWRAGEEQSDLQQLPMNLVSPQHTLLEDFESAATWAWPGFNLEPAKADDTLHRQGVNSMKVTVPQGGTSTLRKSGFSLDLTNVGTVQLSIYLPDAPNAASFTIRLYNPPDYNAGHYDKGVTCYLLRTGWNTVSIQKDEFTATGGPTWSSIWGIQIDFGPKAGLDWIVYLDNLTVGPSHQPAVLLTFDDAYASVHQNAFPYMRSKRIRGTVYTVAGNVGNTTVMTQPQLAELYAAGWDIGNHTNSHTDLTTLSEAQQEAELSTCRLTLDSWGLTRASRHVAYPENKQNADTLTAMAATGMLTGRYGMSLYEQCPYSEAYLLKAKSIQSSTEATLAAATALIDTVVTNNYCGVFYLHGIVGSSPQTIDWLTSDFRGLIDYIVSKNLPCLTISELYNLQSGAVTIPR